MRNSREVDFPFSPDYNAASMKEVLKEKFARVRPYVPVISFFGGFLWDAVTLGQSIKPSDLWILLGYLSGAAVILVLLGRGVKFRYSEYLNAVLQFLFGGIFSALFIFYFLSSSDLPGFFFVLLLGALLVGNEFLESAYSKLTLSWTFFAVCAVMFFNFALPHVFHSLSVFWFYLGTLLAILLTAILWRFSHREKGSLTPSVITAAMLLVLHAANMIPPVPLVKKEMLVAPRIIREGALYRATIEPAPLWKFWTPASSTIHRDTAGRVYCFTSVFIPSRLSTTITHRWQRYSEVSGEWIDRSRIRFPIEGGRKSGYRGYSWKENVEPGKWRVIAEAESGAAIGVLRFDVVAGVASKTKVLPL